MDLYVFRDEAVAFYVGQSQLALFAGWENSSTVFMDIPSLGGLYGVIGQRR